MQTAWRRQVIKTSVLELQIEHLYSTCHRQLTLSKIRPPFPLCYLQSSIRVKVPLSYKKEETPNSLQWGQRKGSGINGLLPENHCMKSVTYWSPQSWFYFWWMMSRITKCKVFSTLLQHYINLYIHEEIKALTHLNKLLTTQFHTCIYTCTVQAVLNIRQTLSHHSSIIWAAALCLITLHSENSSHDRKQWHDKNDKLHDKSRWDFFLYIIFFSNYKYFITNTDI